MSGCPRCGSQERQRTSAGVYRCVAREQVVEAAPWTPGGYEIWYRPCNVEYQDSDPALASDARMCSDPRCGTFAIGRCTRCADQWFCLLHRAQRDGRDLCLPCAAEEADQVRRQRDAEWVGIYEALPVGDTTDLTRELAWRAQEFPDYGTPWAHRFDHLDPETIEAVFVDIAREYRMSGVDQRTALASWKSAAAPARSIPDRTRAWPDSLDDSHFEPLNLALLRYRIREAREKDDTRRHREEERERYRTHIAVVIRWRLLGGLFILVAAGAIALLIAADSSKATWGEPSDGLISTCVLAIVAGLVCAVGSFVVAGVIDSRFPRPYNGWKPL